MKELSLFLSNNHQQSQGSAHNCQRYLVKSQETSEEIDQRSERIKSCKISTEL